MNKKLQVIAIIIVVAAIVAPVYASEPASSELTTARSVVGSVVAIFCGINLYLSLKKIHLIRGLLWFLGVATGLAIIGL